MTQVNGAFVCSHRRLARAVREQRPLINLALLPGRYGTTAVAETLAVEGAEQIGNPQMAQHIGPVGHREAGARPALVKTMGNPRDRALGH